MFNKLLEKILALDEIVITVGRSDSIAELFIKDPHIELTGGWLTCECESWHIHMKYDDLAEVKFVEAPSHGSHQMGYSIRFIGGDGDQRLAVYFLNLYDKEGSFL